MLKVFAREKNKRAERDRKEGKTPGVIYGPSIESLPIYAEAKEFFALIKEHEGGLFEIEFEGQKYQGILREVQFHPLNHKPIHFDIYVPSLEEEIETKVPLEFVGSAPALLKGGVLNFNLKELEIFALPQDIPERIEVDISQLEEIGQSLYVKDLKILPKIKVVLDKDLPVVTVIAEEAETEIPPETPTNA
jgi:large subunit ribosomal protein L25